MNLENLYGTQDSLVKVFERALQQNDPKKVFFHLISIYIKSDKHEVTFSSDCAVGHAKYDDFVYNYVVNTMHALGSFCI